MNALNSKSLRYDFIDSSRGLLLVLMCIDHARSFIHRSHPIEMWANPFPDYQGDFTAFLLRIVSHVCAPGFFFILGVSVVLYLNNKNISQDKGHFLKRGLFLILVQLTVVNLAWLIGNGSALVEKENYGFIRSPGDIGSVYSYIGVIFALGAALIVCGFISRLSLVSLFVIAMLLQLPTVYMMQAVAPKESLNLLLGLFVLPGRSGVIEIKYPLLPWLSLSVLGMCYAKLLVNNKINKYTDLLLSLVLFAMFFLWQYFINHEYALVADQSLWLKFLNMTKYPPSIAFQLFNLACIFAFFFAFKVLHKEKLLKVYGRSSIFFYIVHLYILAALGFVFFRYGGSYLSVILSSIFTVFVLYYICRWWKEFKRKTNSRMLSYL